MQFIGANSNATAVGGDELPGKSNYLIGNDPEQWHTNVPNFARVQYREVYPGIDLVYYGTQGHLEYDFVVAPGADAGVIRLGLAEGIQAGREQPAPSSRHCKIKELKAKLDPNGDLVVKIGASEVRFHQPVAYQPDGLGNRRYVEARYLLRHQRSAIFKQQLSIAFRVVAYDRTRPLIIDPTLTYSTYLGGSEADVGYGIAVDSSGNTYIAGQTCSTNFPTAGPEQAASAGQCDAFVTKLNPTGSALVYSTYLGGSAGDSAAAVALDSSGDAYVTGTTNSTNFPTTAGAFQTVYGGGDTDAFISELNPAGSALLYSTYLGGNDSDTGAGIALDSSNDAVVAGQTCSANFPLLNQLAQDFVNLINVGADYDAFVTKLNPAGSALVFSTYLGGATADAAYAVAVDSQGAAFVTGSTDSSNFPLAGAIQPAFGGSPSPPAPLFPGDAFVSKIQPGGAALVYSTYLGGSGADAGYGIAVDSLGDAYVAGFTTSGNFPVTPGVLSATLDGSTDAFVSKLNPLGSALVYSTYLGGSGVDEAFAIAVDINGVAYVTGGTASSDFPTVGALQNTLGGPLAFPGDAFVSKVDSSGGGLIYSSYLGGGDQDVGNAITVLSVPPAPPPPAPAPSGPATYVTGSTFSTDFPTTPNPPGPVAFQTAQGGLGDAFVVALTNLTAPVALVSPRTLNYGSQGIGIPTSCLVPTVIPPNAAIPCPAANVASVTIANTGDAPLTISQIVEVGGFSNPTPPAPPVDLQEWSIASDTCSGATVQPSNNCTFTVPFNPQLTGARSGTVTITDNATSATQTIDLSGTGVNPPAVSTSPASVTFGSQLSGTTSSAQAVTLTNSGGFALTIASIAVTAGFAQTNTCGSSLGPGLPCTINITFSPSTSGSVTGTLTITDDATTSPQSVPLAGTGVAPVADVAPTSLTFANQAVNTASGLQSATLSNTGTSALNITSITLSGTNAKDFALTQTCGSSLAVGAGCAINITFTPSGAGPRVASVSITDNAAGSPQTISLVGTGITVPVASLNLLSLTFSAEKQGITSPPQTVTLSNTGTAPLTISGISASSGFAATSTCPSSLAPGGSCKITVTFTPSASGNFNGTVTITDNASDSPQTISLAGTGQAAPIASLQPATITFTGQSVGTTSAAQTVTLSNSGSATLSVTSISFTGANRGDFAQTNTCAASIAAGSSCTINVTFTPAAAGTRTANLSVADNAVGSPQTVSLGGIGADFSLAVAPSTTTTLAGNPANYTVTVTPQNGFSGKVTFTCSHLPPLSTCSASPASLTEDGMTPMTATITVNTTVRSAVWRGPRFNWPRPLGRAPQPWTLWVLMVLTLAALALSVRERTRWRLAGLAALMLLIATWAACSGSPSAAATGTPAGSYMITVGGASGPVSHNATVMLQVQ
ncbi:MAG TPA: choice-of-anchor D domain-containing protein [Terriglobia bacterium]